MTFGTLRTILRNDILAEASADYYSDADLLDFLRRAANELSGALGFPIKNGTADVGANSTSFAIATDAAVDEIHQVVYSGFALRFAPYFTVKQYQSYADSGFPRYYYFNQQTGGTVVEFAPPAPTAGVINYEYREAYDASGVSESVAPWDGLFPRFHELIAVRAGVKAFDASLEEERADRWLMKHDRLIQEFALYLGKSDVVQSIMLGGERESERAD